MGDTIFEPWIDNTSFYPYRRQGGLYLRVCRLEHLLRMHVGGWAAQNRLHLSSLSCGHKTVWLCNYNPKCSQVCWREVITDWVLEVHGETTSNSPTCDGILRDRVSRILSIREYECSQGNPLTWPGTTGFLSSNSDNSTVTQLPSLRTCVQKRLRTYFMGQWDFALE